MKTRNGPPVLALLFLVTSYCLVGIVSAATIVRIEFTVESTISSNPLGLNVGDHGVVTQTLNEYRTTPGDDVTTWSALNRVALDRIDEFEYTGTIGSLNLVGYGSYKDGSAQNSDQIFARLWASGVTVGFDPVNFFYYFHVRRRDDPGPGDFGLRLNGILPDNPYPVGVHPTFEEGLALIESNVNDGFKPRIGLYSKIDAGEVRAAEAEIVSFQVIPEPSAPLLVLSGLAFAVLIRRRG